MNRPSTAAGERWLSAERRLRTFQVQSFWFQVRAHGSPPLARNMDMAQVRGCRVVKGRGFPLSMLIAICAEKRARIPGENEKISGNCWRWAAVPADPAAGVRNR